MSKAGQILIDEVKATGIEGAEVLIVKLHGAAEKALAKIQADEETSSSEKYIAGFLIPIVSGLKGAVEKLADLNKDGHVGPQA